MNCRRKGDEGRGRKAYPRGLDQLILSDRGKESGKNFRGYIGTPRETSHIRNRCEVLGSSAKETTRIKTFSPVESRSTDLARCPFWGILKKKKSR